MSENKSPVERLRLALANREEEKKLEAQQRESEALQAAELAELYKQLETLPQQERRRILVQAGIKLTTEAPPPITPLRGGRMFASANTEITRDDLSAPEGRGGMPLEMKKIIWPAQKIAIPVSDLHCLLADAVTRNPPPHPDEDDEEWATYEQELGLNLVRYESTIDAAITRGELPIRDPITGERLPSHVNAQHAVVSMKDLQEYLKRSGSFVELSIEPESVSAESHPTSSSMTAQMWCGDEEKAPPDWTDEEVEAARVEVEAIQAAEARSQAHEQEAERERMQRNWWGVSSSYIVSVMLQHQCATAKDLFNRLHQLAGDDSPFARGQAANRGSLFVKDLAQNLSLKTVQNNWGKIKAAAFG